MTNCATLSHGFNKHASSRREAVSDSRGVPGCTEKISKNLRLLTCVDRSTRPIHHRFCLQLVFITRRSTRCALRKRWTRVRYLQSFILHWPRKHRTIHSVYLLLMTYNGLSFVILMSLSHNFNTSRKLFLLALLIFVFSHKELIPPLQPWRSFAMLPADVSNFIRPSFPS